MYFPGRVTVRSSSFEKRLVKIFENRYREIVDRQAFYGVFKIIVAGINQVR
jgi:hypothetical protein